MARYIFGAMLLGALLEFASIIWVGQRLGIIATLGLMLAGGIAGVSVIKSGGAGLIALMQRPPRDFHFASREAAGRFLTLAAGLLLIIPGFFSDALAVVLLLPPVQAVIARRLAAKVKVQGAEWHAERRNGTLVIEGEAIEIQTADDPKKPD